MNPITDRDFKALLPSAKELGRIGSNFVILQVKGEELLSLPPIPCQRDTDAHAEVLMNSKYFETNAAAIASFQIPEAIKYAVHIDTETGKAYIADGNTRILLEREGRIKLPEWRLVQLTRGKTAEGENVYQSHNTAKVAKDKHDQEFGMARKLGLNDYYLKNSSNYLRTAFAVWGIRHNSGKAITDKESVPFLLRNHPKLYQHVFEVVGGNQNLDRIRGVALATIYASYIACPDKKSKLDEFWGDIATYNPKEEEPTSTARKTHYYVMAHVNSSPKRIAAGAAIYSMGIRSFLNNREFSPSTIKSDLLEVLLQSFPRVADKIVDAWFGPRG